MSKNLTSEDIQHLRYVIALLRSEERNSLADRLLDFTENRIVDNRHLIHTEQGTPSQVTQSWDRLAREEREPS